MDRANAEGTALVSVRGVSKTYAQDEVQVHALRGINLTISGGEFLTLVGPSGSGKTTLLNMIGALDRPTTGNISIGDTDVASASAKQLSQLRLTKIGFVFQDYNLLPVLSALENVEYVPLLQGVSPQERRQRANEALVQVGLDGYQHRRPAQLSGGQQQRVAVARAIAGRPLLVLADEPTANLDSETGESLVRMMRKLNGEQGTTFVFSTHDDMVMRHASRIVRLKDGLVVEDASHALA
ncbi:MAG TPA: ABC transporter ATP-binding protein [Ideonella sp.]|uniref:ABC transporter ATP-binding protein n=1 Tax=Ideonella sp. TaxID=1929293 RepID=UPI002E372C4B|nr:ABC transporter ATP-binding protein [Ideonella sp.]HEX5686532.1 ABC transporter ATP-binding protein [Ideonella sp.]